MKLKLSYYKLILKIISSLSKRSTTLYQSHGLYKGFKEKYRLLSTLKSVAKIIERTAYSSAVRLPSYDNMILTLLIMNL